MYKNILKYYIMKLSQKHNNYIISAYITSGVQWHVSGREMKVWTGKSFVMGNLQCHFIMQHYYLVCNIVMVAWQYLHTTAQTVLLTTVSSVEFVYTCRFSSALTPMNLSW